MSDPTFSLSDKLIDRERDLRTMKSRNARAAAVLDVVSALTNPGGLVAMADHLVEICRRHLDADAVVLLQRSDSATMRALASTDAKLGREIWRDACDVLSVPRRIINLTGVPWSDRVPARAGDFRSLLSVPAAAGDGERFSIVALAADEDKFLRQHMAILQSIAVQLTSHLDRIRLSRRNVEAARTLNQGNNSTANIDNNSPASPIESESADQDELLYKHQTVIEINAALANVDPASTNYAIRDAIERASQLVGARQSAIIMEADECDYQVTHRWISPLYSGENDDWINSENWNRLKSQGQLQGAVILDAAREFVACNNGDAKKAGPDRCPVLAVPVSIDASSPGFWLLNVTDSSRSIQPSDLSLLSSVATSIGAALISYKRERELLSTQKALDAKGRRLRAILNNLPAVVLEVDHQGRILSWSKGSETDYLDGMRIAEGRGLSEALPPSVYQHFEDMKRQKGEGEIFREHVVRNSHDVGERVILLSLRVFESSDRPEATRYVLMLQDVTETQAQSRRIGLLSKAVELTSNSIIMTDLEGRIEWVNPAFEKRTGWSLREVQGQPPGKILQSTKTSEESIAGMARAIKERVPVQEEFMNVDRFGEEYWVRMDIQPVENEFGQVVGFMGVQVDITSLKESYQRLLQERAVAMDSAEFGIAICDSSGNYTYMNRAHRRMFGVERDHAVESLNFREFCDPKFLNEFIDDHWERFVKSGHWRGRVLGRRRDGSVFPQEVSLSLLEGGGHMCFARDISGEVESERERERLRNELEFAHRRETMAHVACDVAHDLNNLIGVISGSAEVLEDQGIQNPEVVAGLDRIKRGVETAQDLVQSLGHLGRPRSLRAEQDLNRLVRRAVELLGVERIATHSIRTKLPAEPVYIWANETEALQVLVNLAINAVDATDPGEGQITLAVRATAPEGVVGRPEIGRLRDDRNYTYFSITDSGCGIGPQDRKRLFDRYFTTKGESGTGLGLPIVATILRENHAVMWIESVPGEGTTFTVAWPADTVNGSSEGSTVRRRVPELSLKGLTVLVVDDSRYIVDFVDSVLEKSGATVISTDDSMEAHKLLISEPTAWSVLVTDLDMPEIDGRLLAEAASNAKPEVATILISGDPEALRYDRDLFCEILQKPLDAQSLILSVYDAAAMRKRF